MRLPVLFALITSFLSSYSFGQEGTRVIRNLVFEGGGVRGIAYAGALMELNERKQLDSIVRVAGTSAGAIAATLYAVGYTPEEILDLVSEVRIKGFADGRWIFIGGTRRMIRNFGWYRGEKFNRWMSSLIKAKTGKEDITFKELYIRSGTDKRFKQLYLTGTNLTLQKTSILCHETFPQMEVRTGVRISMSIPFFFQAVTVDRQGKVCTDRGFENGYVMVDGGIIANYPIHIFDYRKYLEPTGDSAAVVNYQTLGLRLDDEKQIDWDRQCKGLCPAEIRTMKDFTMAFYNIILESLNRSGLSQEDWKRTVSISTGGVGPKIRKMPQREKDLLVENGRKSVSLFFYQQ